MDNNNNFGRDQFNIYDPTGKISIGGADASRPSNVSGIGGNPPSIENYWVDRTDYQTQLTERLVQSNVTEIVATGGFGKSSLAAWAYEHRCGDFKRRVWVDFQRGQGFHSFAQHVLQEIDKPNHDPQATEATLLQDLLVRLRDANVPVKTLVVMDQLEAIAQTDDWQWFKEFLEKWAADGKVSRVLVTTRSRILTQEPIDLGGMNVAEGTVFFEREGLTGDRFPDLIELAGGHPLLLKLAAIWTRETYGARVDDRAIDFFGKLFANYRGDPTKGVAVIFGVIFEELPIGLQDLLCGVSVYRLPFGEAMAQAIGPSATIEDLKLLGDRGLLLQQGEEFTLHPLVAELVRSRVSEEVRVAGHAGAIRYYSENFREWDGTIESCREILESFYHACELGQYGLAYGMLDRCVNQLNRAGQWRSLLPLYGRLTTEWQSADDAEAKNLGWAWTRLGNLHWYLGDYRSAINAQQQAQAIFDEINFPEGQASSLGSLGNAYQSLGQYQRAIDFYEQSLEIEREISDRGGEANSLGNLGIAYESLGQYQRAINFLQQQNEIVREIGDCGGEANSLGNLGNVYQSLGQYQRAINFHQQSLEIKREIGDRGGEANSLGNLGIAYESLGQYQRAINFLQQQNEIVREISNRWGEGASLLNIANALAKLDNHAQALLNFQQAQAIYEDLELDHMVEKCKTAICGLNQIIAPQHQAPPTLDIPKANPQDDWWESNLPANERKVTATQQFSGDFWWWFAGGLALALLIYWLKR
jgi:tetratricopeptide (TPR) repeat protein